ncbi:hypothetical protein ACHAWF_016081 [Thalassiosira exigua]
MFISLLLQAMVATTLDDSSNDACHFDSQALVGCLRVAGLNRTEARECILCPIARAENSRATTCKQFEREGFCEDCKRCEHKDCPTSCWSPFDDWLKCKVGQIGCGEMCDEQTATSATSYL